MTGVEIAGLITAIAGGIGSLMAAYRWGARRKGAAEARKTEADAKKAELENKALEISIYEKSLENFSKQLDERDAKINELTALVRQVSDQNIELLKVIKEKDSAIDELKLQMDQLAKTQKKLEADYNSLLKLYKQTKN